MKRESIAPPLCAFQHCVLVLEQATILLEEVFMSSKLIIILQFSHELISTHKTKKIPELKLKKINQKSNPPTSPNPPS